MRVLGGFIGVCLWVSGFYGLCNIAYYVRGFGAYDGGFGLMFWVGFVDFVLVFWMRFMGVSGAGFAWVFDLLWGWV